MKKLLALTLFGLLSIPPAAQAHAPNLNDYGYKPGEQTIKGASYIIRAAASNGTIKATLKDGTTYQFYISDRGAKHTQYN